MTDLPRVQNQVFVADWVKPRQLTQSSPSAASSPSLLKSYQVRPVDRCGRRLAQNYERQRVKRSDGGGTQSSRSMTRQRRCSPDTVTCHHHWGQRQTSRGAGESTPTGSPHLSVNISAESPREETNGLRGSFPETERERERECSPCSTGAHLRHLLLLLWLPLTKTLSRSMLPIGSPRHGGAAVRAGSGKCAHTRMAVGPFTHMRTRMHRRALVETTDTTLWPTKVLECLVRRRDARSKIKTRWPQLRSFTCWNRQLETLQTIPLVTDM